MDFLTAQSITGIGMLLDLVGAVGLAVFAMPLRVINRFERRRRKRFQTISWGLIALGFLFQLIGNYTADETPEIAVQGLLLTILVAIFLLISVLQLVSSLQYSKRMIRIYPIVSEEDEDDPLGSPGPWFAIDENFENLAEQMAKNFKAITRLERKIDMLLDEQDD